MQQMLLGLGGKISYDIDVSTTYVNEGSTVTTTITTKGVANGTTLYWSVDGSVTSADFSSGSMTGSGTTSNGSFSFSHTISADLTTEGTESYAMKLYEDSGRTILLDTSATVTVADSSVTPTMNTYGLEHWWEFNEDTYVEHDANTTGHISFQEQGIIFSGPSGDYQMGTGDFTIECWVWKNNSSHRGIWQISTSSQGLQTSNLDLTLAVGFQNYRWQIYGVNNGVGYTEGPTMTTYPPNGSGDWHHLALVRRSGSILTLYVDGVKHIEETGCNQNYTGNYICLGGYYNTSYRHFGRISNFRLVKGQAVYTEQFTPPSGPLSAESGGADLTNVKLLGSRHLTNYLTWDISPLSWSLSGQNVSSPGYQYSGSNHTNARGYVADLIGTNDIYDGDSYSELQGSTAGKKYVYEDGAGHWRFNYPVRYGKSFGYGAVQYDGASNDDYVYTSPGSNDSLFNMNTNTDFTLEAFVKVGSVGTGAKATRNIISRWQSGNYCYQMHFRCNPSRIGFTGGPSIQVESSDTCNWQANTWHHVAITRRGGNSNNCTFWADGVQKGTFTYTQGPYSNNDQPVVIGANLDGVTTYSMEDGMISNVRIVSGYAVYGGFKDVSSFTPPTEPLTGTSQGLGAVGEENSVRLICCQDPRDVTTVNTTLSNGYTSALSSSSDPVAVSDSPFGTRSGAFTFFFSLFSYTNPSNWWMMATNNDGNNFIGQINDNFRLDSNQDIKADYQASSNTVPNNQEVTFYFTMSASGTFKVYKNGTYLGSGNYVGTWTDDNVVFEYLDKYSGTSYQWTKQMFFAGFYNRELSASEISSNQDYHNLRLSTGL